MRRQILISLALIAITIAIYWPVRNYGLIEFDDPEFVRDKAEITTGLTWTNVRWAFSNPVAANWHPVTTLSHMLDCQLFSRNLGAHHLVSVGIHAANGALLFLLLTQMTGALWRSALVAAIFAWHPLRVESVVWIAERKDVLSGFFFFLTLLAYVNYVAAGKSQAPKEGLSRFTFHVSRFYVLSLGLFALGLMSKPMLVTLPFVLLLLDFWPLRRLHLPAFNGQLSTCRRLLLEKVPFFALAAAASWLTIYFQKGGMPSLASISLHDRIANAIVSYLRYLGKAFWPTNLAVIYPHPAALHPFTAEWPDWAVVLIALLWLAITAICLLQFRTQPYLAVGWLWFLGTMVPVIGIIQVGEQAMADRYTYLPLIGATFAVVWLCAEFFHRRKREITDGLSPYTFLIAVPVLAACCVLTYLQIQHWSHTITLFTHAAKVTKNNSTAEFFIALGFERESQPDEATAHYEAALAINPSETQAHYNLAQLLRKSGHWREAAEHYEAVLRIHPDDLKSRLNLANVLSPLGRAKEAASLYEEVLQSEPDSIEALNNLAWLLATASDAALRNGSRAVQLAQRACELSQFKLTTLVGTLAAAYAEAGQFPAAVATEEKACALAAQSSDESLFKKNQELLELYKSGNPYHEPAGPEH